MPFLVIFFIENHLKAKIDDDEWEEETEEERKEDKSEEQTDDKPEDDDDNDDDDDDNYIISKKRSVEGKLSSYWIFIYSFFYSVFVPFLLETKSKPQKVKARQKYGGDEEARRGRDEETRRGGGSNRRVVTRSRRVFNKGKGRAK